MSLRSSIHRFLNRIVIPLGGAVCAVVLTSGAVAQSKPVTIPVLVPLTGFLSLEGTSQRNGADCVRAARLIALWWCSPIDSVQRDDIHRAAPDIIRFSAREGVSATDQNTRPKGCIHLMG